MLNKDEIYLICKKLDLGSTINFSFISKKFRSIIILHETLLKEKFASFHLAKHMCQTLFSYHVTDKIYGSVYDCKA
jgi:hypothetical protein